MNTTELKLQSMHEEIEKLTGDSWVPYPSELFMDFILSDYINVGLKKLFIKKRRMARSPEFINGDPFSNLLEDAMIGNVPQNIIDQYYE